MKRYLTADARFSLALVTPTVVCVVGLTIYPILYDLYLSLFQKHAFLEDRTFVGAANYSDTLRDPEFWSSFRNGVVYAAASLALQLALGLLGALILNERFRGRNLLRGVVLFPYLLPTITVVILWKWLLNSSYGLVDYLIGATHLTSSRVLWFSKDHIMLTLVLVSTWQFFPFILVALLARLQTIPEDLYRAARIDGAPAFSRFIHITLPALKKTLITVVLIRSIWMFTKFDTVWLLAGQEANGKYVQTLPVLTFRVTFAYLQAGMGATLAAIMFAMLALATLAYLRVMDRQEGPG